MLARVCATALCATVLFPQVPALADGGPPSPPPVQVSGDNQAGYVTTQVQAPGKTSGSAPQQTAYESSSDSGIKCNWTENSARLENEYQSWLGWGAPGGHWYDVHCSDGSVFLSIYVPPAANNSPPPAALANALVQRAVNELKLPTPMAAHNPPGDSVSNLTVWWWIPRSRWVDLTQRTQAGPVWARVTARPTSTTWDPGDGSTPLTCDGPGIPYDKSRPASEQSTACSHTYTRSSAGQPQTGPNPNDRFFIVRVTVTWQVTWVGVGGAGGALPPITRTATFPLRVVDRETVVTDGSG